MGVCVRLARWESCDRWDEIDHQPTNSLTVCLAALFRRAAALSVISLFSPSGLSYLSADSVAREAGAKALARDSPWRIRHPQIACLLCLAVLRPCAGVALYGSCR